MNFSDLNVFFYNKDKKESIYLGTAWSNEQFKSLPQDVAESISQQKPLAKTAETSLAVGDVVEFKYDKDYYINTAVEKGLMPDAVAAGTIKSLNKDGSYVIESYVGDVNVQAKNVSGTDNPTLYDRQNSYETIKSEIDKSVKIEAPEKKQTPKAEKAKGESKEKAVKQEKGEKQEKSASKATSKPKTKGSELSM
jgi:Mg-chelatase subunit ChlI